MEGPWVEWHIGDLGTDYSTCVKMAVTPSDVYPHVYAFLLENKLTKTAKRFYDECGTVSVYIVSSAEKSNSFNCSVYK